MLDFFDELIGDETVPMSEMKDRIPEHSATWRARWEKMTGALDSADEGQLEWDRNLNPLSLLVAFVGGVLVAVICLIQNNVEGKWFIAAAIGAIGVAIVALWPSRRLRRLAPEYRERSAKWESFQRWTDDFPRLKDDPPATLELWKRILIYGVAFGTADRMIKSGRIPAPVLAELGRILVVRLPHRRVRRLLLQRQLASAPGSPPRWRPSPPAVAEAASAAAGEAAAAAAVAAAGRSATAYSSPAAFSAVPRSWNS